jgi:hypothetical protein
LPSPQKLIEFFNQKIIIWKHSLIPKAPLEK